ncbi:MAG TPA: hypothetical protein VGR35_01130 [Tepidisphaeraceae bacterium]|nr:hypothetical protein [Tepidisphaeraceae bacterium]
MRRKLFILCWVVSLLLFAASLVAGLGTLVGRADLMRTTDTAKFSITSSGGVVTFLVSDRYGTEPRGRWMWNRSDDEMFRPGSRWAGFGTLSGAYTHFGGRYHGVQIPWWFIWLATAVPPTWLWMSHRRHARWLRRSGRCPACGYDMRATPERCPECGTVPTGRESPHNPAMQRTGGSGTRCS